MTEEDGKGGKMPRLTIMEEVLLLGLKDKQVRPANLSSPPSSPFSPCLLFLEPIFYPALRWSEPAAVSVRL